METAVTEITLVLFTTVAPAGTIAYLIVAGIIIGTKDAARRCALSHYLVVPLVLVLGGLIASATHLGTPANALYVLTGIMRSPLSNEVVAVIAFLALGGIYWTVSFRDDVPRKFCIVWLSITEIAGMVFVCLVSLAYSVPSIPTWNLPTAPATLWLNALSSGPLVAAATILLAKQAIGKRAALALVGSSVTAAVANVVVLAAQWSMLDGIATTTTQASELIPPLSLICGAYLVLTLLACGICATMTMGRKAVTKEGDPFLSLQRTRTLHTVGICASAILVLIACFIVRFAFYMMHMTVGI